MMYLIACGKQNEKKIIAADFQVAYKSFHIMDIVYINTSVVVLAFDHNPTLLHPYFLKNENISLNELDELKQLIENKIEKSK